MLKFSQDAAKSLRMLWGQLRQTPLPPDSHRENSSPHSADRSLHRPQTADANGLEAITNWSTDYLLQAPDK
jgi:hypothetical protein